MQADGSARGPVRPARPGARDRVTTAKFGAARSRTASRAAVRVDATRWGRNRLRVTILPRASAPRCSSPLDRLVEGAIEPRCGECRHDGGPVHDDVPRPRGSAPERSATVPPRGSASSGSPAKPSFSSISSFASWASFLAFSSGSASSVSCDPDRTRSACLLGGDRQRADPMSAGARAGPRQRLWALSGAELVFLVPLRSIPVAVSRVAS